MSMQNMVGKFNRLQQLYETSSKPPPLFSNFGLADVSTGGDSNRFQWRMTLISTFFEGVKKKKKKGGDSGLVSGSPV